MATLTLKSKSKISKSNLANRNEDKVYRLAQARRRFKKLLPKLLENHKGKYAAVIGDAVEIHENKNDLLKMVIENYGYKTMYIGKIDLEEEILKIHSPKTIKSN